LIASTLALNTHQKMLWCGNSPPGGVSRNRLQLSAFAL
jgi:hypothetical protein